MNPTRSHQPMLLALIVAVAGVAALATPASARADSYAAIAYSEDTGQWGYSYGLGCRAEAENDALSRCGGDDARIVVWCENACAALAVGDNGAYGYAWGSCRAEAERRAVRECRKHGCNPHIACWVSSGS